MHKVIPVDEVWLVVGNTHSWGKGTSFSEALGNMLKEAGYSATPTEMVVYRWINVPDDQRDEFYVDGMGTVYGLKGMDPVKLHVKDAAAVKKLHGAYFGFADAVEDFEYRGAMAETFE